MQEDFRRRARRAGALAGIGRSSYRYRACPPELPGWRARLRSLAAERRRFGYLRLLVMRRREGWAVHHQRVYRRSRTEGLAGWRRPSGLRAQAPGGVPKFPVTPALAPLGVCVATGAEGRRGAVPAKLWFSIRHFRRSVRSPPRGARIAALPYACLANRHIRVRLKAVQVSATSTPTLLKPRNRKRHIPRCSFRMPITGSTSAWRRR